MSPAGVLAPETTEVVPNGVVRGLGQTLVLTPAKAVVALSNLPDCARA